MRAGPFNLILLRNDSMANSSPVRLTATHGDCSGPMFNYDWHLLKTGEIVLAVHHYGGAMSHPTLLEVDAVPLTFVYETYCVSHL